MLKSLDCFTNLLDSRFLALAQEKINRCNCFVREPKIISSNLIDLILYKCISFMHITFILSINPNFRDLAFANDII